MMLQLYFDRGAIASVLPSVKAHWELSSTEEGAIASAFTIGFMMVSPLWAHIAMKFKANRVIAVGCYLFVLSACLCGVFGSVSNSRGQYWGYILFIICRVLVGVGESALISLVFTIVDDISPKKYKSTYMSIFMCTTPVGVALGYGVSGAIEAYVSYWQLIFFLEAGIMFVLTTICVFTPLHGYVKEESTEPEELTAVSSWQPAAFMNDVQLFEDMNAVGNIDAEEIKPDTVVPDDGSPVPPQPVQKKKKITLFTSLPLLFKNAVYVCIVVISAIYGSIVGALTFWAPSYIILRLQNFDMTDETRTMIANMGFSAIVLVSSIVATSVGGFLLDKSGGPTGWRGVARSLFWSAGYISFGAPLGVVVFTVLSMHYIVVFIVFFFAIFFVMCIATPFQVALMNSVQPDLRHFANSYQIFFLHAFGDLPSPFIVGIISDASNMNLAFLIMWCLLFPGIVVLVVGGILALRNDKLSPPIEVPSITPTVVTSEQEITKIPEDLPEDIM
jgi:MFS family permease